MSRKVFIVGADGYIGWTLALYLSSRGYTVKGIDNGSRRRWVKEVGGNSILPIESMLHRRSILRKEYDNIFNYTDITNALSISEGIREFGPDTIVHLGEMPSAPYSMMNNAKAVYTHNNNVTGTLNILYAMKEHCPEAHLVKLGTLGEYGTPNIAIPEGPIEVEYKGRKSILPFPKQGNSWYHLTKIHDTNNIQFACRTWGLKSTDIMQGVVYGTKIPEMGDNERLYTRFDYDQCFGTVINRFCAQSISRHPITLYGTGEQKRGFLPLKDSMQCLNLAIDNPPEDEGEYKVLNQFEEIYTLKDLAHMVWSKAQELGYSTEIINIPNPRTEMENHYYKPDHQKLLDLGYEPTTDMEKEIEGMLKDLEPYRDRINPKVIMPNITWR